MADKSERSNKSHTVTVPAISHTIEVPDYSYDPPKTITVSTTDGELIASITERDVVVKDGYKVEHS